MSLHTLKSQPTSPGFSRGIATLLAVSAYLLAGTAPASASFPGQNGPIVFESDRGGEFDLYSIGPNGGSLRRLTDYKRGDYSPAVSPRGRKIAFIRNVGNDAEIWLMNADGSNPHRLTHSDFGDYSPSFSPDGRKVVFSRGGDIFVVRIDGSKLRNLTRNGLQNYAPSYSPDGRRIVYQGGSTSDFNIYVMDADGSDQRQLTVSPYQDIDPSFSPDGSSVAYASGQAGVFDIYVMEPDGSGQARLTGGPGSERDPAFSPDGRRIAFIGDGTLSSIRRDGTGQVKVVGGLRTAGGTDWSRRAPFVVGGVEGRVLPVKVFGGGMLAISGPDIDRYQRNVSGPKTIQGPLLLNGPAKELLSDRGWVKVRIRIRFKPEGALVATRVRTVTLRK
jgi:TolB protein